MSASIRIAASEIDRLRSLVEQAVGRDVEAAEQLAAELDRAVILERLPPDVVGLGSRVRFENARTGSVREVTLVYPRDADASAGRISVLAPIGAALLGLSVGDSVEWPLPDGRSTALRILAVDATSHEQAGSVA